MTPNPSLHLSALTTRISPHSIRGVADPTVSFERSGYDPFLKHTRERAISPQDASVKLVSYITVTRVDIARAKEFILASKESGTDALAEKWLHDGVGPIPKDVEIQSAGANDTLTLLGRGYSLRLAFYQAVWELVAACELFPGGTATWEPQLTWRNTHGGGGLQLDAVKCIFPEIIRRPPLSDPPPTDPDIFLQGANCVSLHLGIREAIGQSLACFQRGLYLPAIVMLAAGAEATWIECGAALAGKLADAKLRTVVDDSFVSLSRKVTEVKRALESPSGKNLLKVAGISVARVTDAEVWTTTLRERRNAVHWGKAQSFIAQHSDASSLLLAAPLHMGTLEAVRRVCVKVELP